MKTPQLLGLTPYVYYDDAGAMADFLVKVFGFVELGRHLDEAGKVRNVELRVGASELWLDGYQGHGTRVAGPPAWTGVWVEDVDAMYERVLRFLPKAEEPENKPYGVRMLSVKDPEGMTWGFMCRLSADLDEPRPPS